MHPLEAASVGFALSPHCCLIKNASQRISYIRTADRNFRGCGEEDWISNSNDMKNIFSNKDFWKDALLFLGVLCLFYLIYVAVEYWPEIVEGFKRGWSGE